MSGIEFLDEYFNELRAGNLAPETLLHQAEVRVLAPMVLRAPQLPLLALEDPARYRAIVLAAHKEIGREYFERLFWPWRLDWRSHAVPILATTTICLDAIEQAPPDSKARAIRDEVVALAERARSQPTLTEEARLRGLQSAIRSIEEFPKDATGVLLWLAFQMQRSPAFIFQVWLDLVNTGGMALDDIVRRIAYFRQEARRVIQWAPKHPEHEKRRCVSPTPRLPSLGTPKAAGCIRLQKPSSNASAGATATTTPSAPI